jgi:hypothetical protein
MARAAAERTGRARRGGGKGTGRKKAPGWLGFATFGPLMGCCWVYSSFRYYLPKDI